MNTTTPRPLEGHQALVTGGTRNIGRAVALALANDGADVTVVSRRRDADAEATLAMIGAAGARGLHITADVSDEAAVAAMVEESVARHGGLDILVHCAAIRRLHALADITLAEWREVMATNLDAAFLCSRAALPHLQSGRGRLIYISGLTGFKGAEDRAHVITSKAGLVGLARALATELAPQQITVNCVSPGPTATVRGADAGKEPPHPQSMQPLIGRRGYPEEIAAAVRYLASDGAAFVTGQVIHVNGGLYFG